MTDEIDLLLMECTHMPDDDKYLGKTSVKDIQCELCKYKTMMTNDLSDHRESHNCCVICDLVFPNKKQFKSHKYQVHGKKLFCFGRLTAVEARQFLVYQGALVAVIVQMFVKYRTYINKTAGGKSERIF